MNILCGLYFVLFLILCGLQGCGGLPVSRLIPAATATEPSQPTGAGDVQQRALRRAALALRP